LARSDHLFFNGDNLQGIIDKTNYIQNLGATAVWITPPVANLWFSDGSSLTSYHGYWTRHFKKVDEHLGSLETYKALSSNLHNKGMYLVQDIVVNHVGRYYQYKGNYDPENTAHNFEYLEGNLPSKNPTQYPFNLNDRNNAEHVKADIYHWTPEIKDYNDPIQEALYQLAGLNDLNTSNHLVRETLKESYGYWIKEVGVDAFRLDTAKFVEHDYLNDFIHSDNGILATAAKTGRHSFPIFGEIFEIPAAMDNSAELKIASFQGTDSKPELNAVIGFPLYEAISRVFSQGRPTSYLSYRLTNQMNIYKNPYMVANFVDNHDVQRFLAKSNLASLKQAYALIMTVPGIPVIYQGDEQVFEQTRRSMFKGGYLSDEDQF